MVVKPVGQMLVYEVVITVVIVSGCEEVGAEVTEGEAVMVGFVVVPSLPVGWGRPVPLIMEEPPEAPAVAVDMLELLLEPPLGPAVEASGTSVLEDLPGITLELPLGPAVGTSGTPELEEIVWEATVELPLGPTDGESEAPGVTGTTGVTFGELETGTDSEGFTIALQVDAEVCVVPA